MGSAHDEQVDREVAEAKRAAALEAESQQHEGFADRVQKAVPGIQVVGEYNPDRLLEVVDNATYLVVRVPKNAVLGDPASGDDTEQLIEAVSDAMERRRPE